MSEKPLTDTGKCFTLELRNQAIICPNCGRRVRGVRLPPGAVMQNVSVMCRECRWVGIVNINEASATYSIARAAKSSNRGR